jgi:peptidoglycan/LPS O-acetylase OafA/YrhL
MFNRCPAAPPAVPPSFGSRLRGIEGLRGLAACSVLVYHSWLYSAPDNHPVQVSLVTGLLHGLAFGVVLFFTLSGFLLYKPYVASILRGKPMPSARAYLRNRALRIAPAYVVILLLVSIVLRSAITYDRAGHPQAGALTEPGLLAKNLLLVQNYMPSSIHTGIRPAWSLAVEVVFYLTLPGLGLLGWVLARSASTRQQRRVAALTPAVLLLAVGAFGKLAAAHASHGGIYHGWVASWESVLERSFLCQADLFFFGMTLAVLRVDAEDGFVRFSRGIRTVAAPLGLLACLATAWRAALSDELGYSFYNTLIAFAFSCLLALVVLPTRGPKPSLLVRILEKRVFVFAGLVSYSVFLWHEPLVHSLQAHGLTAAGTIGLVTNTLLLLGVTVALSTLTYRWVELPALRRKRGPRPERRSADLPVEQVQTAP